MKIKIVIVIIFLPIIFSCQSTNSAESHGPIKSYLIERWKRKESKPPEVTELKEEKILKAGKYTLKISSSGADRYFILHVPESYVPTKPSSLIMAFHGGGGNMNIQYQDQYYRLVSASEKFGFIIAFPNGHSPVASGKVATWNAGRCCGDARDQGVKHVEIVKDMVSKIKTLVNIDSSKVFAIGMSNGGMMSYKLACDAADVFKAIASVAGTDVTTDCKPSRHVSILQIHAKDDDHVLFNGGMGKNAFKDKSKITDFTSVPATIAKWAKINSCQGNATRILNVAGAYCDVYKNCQQGSEVQLCVTETGGHSWPGGVKPRTNDVGTKAIDANTVIWNFLSRQK